MATVTRDQGIGRRLPRWLLGSKSDGPDKHDKLDADKIVTERHKEAVLVQSKDSHLVVDCEIKNGSRRKSRKQKRDDEKSGKFGESEERREELEESEARKRKRPKNSSLGRKEEIKTKSPSNGEVDLTVDDLLLIAKEYVEDNMDIKHQQPLKEDNEFKSMLLKTELSKNESGSCVDHLKTSSSLSAHRPERSCDSNACLRGQSSVDIRETRDPAQEMLDLFLGPLLKRHIEEQKDMEFTFKLERQNNNGGPEELISLGKKKGSLKDKPLHAPDVQKNEGTSKKSHLSSHPSVNLSS